MRAVVQRVVRSSVQVDGQLIGRIGPGLLVLLGVAKGDTDQDAKTIVNKITGLRVFEDEAGKMNQCLSDVAGELLVVSQFTLLGDVRKGRRPSFVQAADPDTGKRLYERVVTLAEAQGFHVATGQFQANMQVELVNDGPVTILLDSTKLF